MKVHLVFPPAWQVTKQYASLPCLVAYLKMQGVDTAQTDVNLELFDYIMSEAYFTELLNEAHTRKDLQQYLTLMEYVRDNMDACKNTIRSETALNLEIYRSCNAFMTCAANLVDKVWSPVERINFGYYAVNGYYNSDSNSVSSCVRDIMAGKVRSRMAEIIDRFIPRLVDKTDLLGLSITAAEQIIPSLLIAALAKRRKPSLRVVVGGALATRWALEPQVMDPLFNYIDYFSFYEGEYPLTVLARSLEGKADLADAPSVAYRKDGKTVINPQIEKPLAMDELPTPEYNAENLHRYFSPTPIVTLFTSRGCYWNRCSFCDHATVYQDCYRIRRTEKILDDIETCVKKYGIRFVDINDEAISAPIMRALSTGILERGLKITWRNDARLDGVLKADTLQLAHKAGLRMLFFGLESYNERVLKLMNKGIDRKNVLPILKAASEAGIWTLVYIIRGFPSETVEEYAETVDFIVKNSNCISNVSVTPFCITAYSRVALDPEKYGITIIDAPHSDLSPHKNFSKACTSPSFSAEGDALTDKVKACKEQHSSFLGSLKILFVDKLIALRNMQRSGVEFVGSNLIPLYSKNGLSPYAYSIGKKRDVTKVEPSLAQMLKIILREKTKEAILHAFESELQMPPEITEYTLERLKTQGILE